MLMALVQEVPSCWFDQYQTLILLSREQWSWGLGDGDWLDEPPAAEPKSPIQTARWTPAAAIWDRFDCSVLQSSAAVGSAPMLLKVGTGVVPAAGASGDVSP